MAIFIILDFEIILASPVVTNIRVQFPADMTAMSSSEALKRIWEVVLENIAVIVPVIAFIWLSVIGGIIMSGVILTCKNITGTLGFFANILLLAIGAAFLFTGSYISQALSMVAKLSHYAVPALLPGICMLVVGVLGILHLCKCFKARGKVCNRIEFVPTNPMPRAGLTPRIIC